VWFWDADRQSGGTDVDAVNPQMVVDVYPFSERSVDTAEYARPGTRTDAQAKETVPAHAVDNPIVPKAGRDGASALEAAGPGTLTFRPSLSQLVRAKGEWKDGAWTVVMTRDMSIGEGQGVSLKPGARVSLALAVWDGAARDRDGQKSISIWQDFVLEEPGR
jgi:DMSO reductase family type II enzyme heme b subunit